MKRLGIVGVGVISLFTALAFAACGDVSGTADLFTSGNGGAGSGTAGGPGATTGPTGSSTSGSPATTTSSTAVSSSSGAATTSSSVASSTASSSTGGPPPPVQVACNAGQCQPGQVCCFNPDGPGDHCGTAGMCAPGWAELDCNGPEDCPGGACCATVDVNKQVPYLGMKCEASCDPTNQVVVCSVQQPDVCPPNTKCDSSQSLGAGYDICWPG